MNKLHAMQIFARVVDVNSFTKAADTLQVARSVVTRAVQELEEHVGVRLINRTTRKLHLTEEGCQYYESVIRILKAVEESESLHKAGVANPKGTLRIDVQTSIAKCVIVPHLHEFRDLYPGIDLIVGTGDRIVDLIEEGVDCAIRVGTLGDSGMIGKQIGVFQRITVASPAYLERQGIPLSIDDLVNHRVVHYTAGKSPRPPMFDFLTDAGPESVRMMSSIQVNDSDTYVALAKAGFGMIQPARFSVANELRAGNLIEILPQNPVPQKPVSLVYPHREKLAPKLRAFLSWSTALFERSPLVSHSNRVTASWKAGVRPATLLSDVSDERELMVTA
ncbi:LysR family transcriptional regulator [Caballeronia calidae]|uniref:LysR family transcriptional regulator n=1 Tax=Caballeronia calidae TaxID=1777139 RepID=A0A158EFY4_9BURK|nr:LysR family transcriptional regulator [Caballeronia calidae]SAL05316.1 LysR family transcriptional regulator [Caballeronia calidae]